MSAEVVVIGAGPAGMAAAVALAECGIDTLVVDEQPAPGGQIYRAVERVSVLRPADLALLGADYRAGLAQVGALRASGARLAFATSVWHLRAGEGGLELGLARVSSPRDPPAGAPRGPAGTGRLELLAPRHVVIASGAMERPVPFPGWTLPGVLGVGAAQTLLKDSGLVPAGATVIAGSGPLAYLFAAQLLATGAPPALLLDTAPRALDLDTLGALLRALPGAAGELRRGLAWLAEIRRAGIPRVRGVSALRALGERRVEGLAYAIGDRHHEVAAELVLVHDGLIPNAHLAMAAGCEHRWDRAGQCWRAVLGEGGASSVAGISIAGDAGGIGGAGAARLAGRLCGLAVAHRLGRLSARERVRRAAPAARALAALRPLRRFLEARFPPRPMFALPPDPATLACRCEEVTVGEIREVAAQGCLGPNQAKAFTRCGMGPCQGRECALTVSRLIAAHHGLAMDEVGHYRVRPPLRPITVADLAALE